MWGADSWINARSSQAWGTGSTPYLQLYIYIIQHVSSQFVVLIVCHGRPLQHELNLFMSLICLTFCSIWAKSAFLTLTLRHSCFIYVLYWLSVVHHILFILSPSPLCGLLGMEVIPHSKERKHSPLWAFKLCLFSKLYVRECCSNDPHTPSQITPPPMIFHSWPLSSPLHGKIPQCWKKDRGPPIRNLATHPSV